MCMKLTIENIAKIKRAELELKGLTVIGGYNNTGKSTIAKSLVAIMNSFCELDQRIINEMRKMVQNKITDWEEKGVFADGENDDVFYNYPMVANKIIQEFFEVHELKFEFFKECMEVEYNISNMGIEFESLFENIQRVLNRPKDEYIKLIVERDFVLAFNKQINSFNNDNNSLISLSTETTTFSVTFEENDLIHFTRGNRNLVEPIYIETVTLLDELLPRYRLNFRNQDINRRRTVSFLQKDPEIDELTIDEYQENKENIKIIKGMLKKIIKGRLIREATGFCFHDNITDRNVSIANLASGLKNYVVIQTLIENGSLKRGGMLIIDEPEVNLHPEWQLNFAHILVLLQKEIGINVLINTHSPYFLQAIEYYSKKEKITDKTNFYSITEEQGFGVTKEVTNSTEEIYQQLAAPMLELQKLEFALEDEND